MRLSIRSVPCLVALSTLACASTAATATNPAHESQEFSLRLRIEETIVFTGAPPCFAVATLSARGWSSQLGEVTAQSEDCVNPKGTFDPGAPATNAFVFTNHPTPFRITTASGDMLFMTYSGTLTPRTDAPHRIRGHFVITGGTGRYSRATGGGTLVGSEDISPITYGRGTVAARGSISF